MDKLIKETILLKNGDKYNDFCIDRALMFLDSAKEVLETTDQEQLYNDEIFTAKTLYKSMPFIYLVQEGLRNENHTRQCQNAVEN